MHTISHSSEGKVEFTIKYNKKSDTLIFTRADGSFLGEMDRESGGLILHPNPAVANFLAKMGTSFYDEDERGYIELEDLLFEEALLTFPGFFKEQE